MGILDGLMDKAKDYVDLDDIAEKVGLSKDELKDGAEKMLGKLGGGKDPDTAAKETEAETGISAEKLKGALPKLGEKIGIDKDGEDGFMDKAKGFIDKDGDGNPINDLSNMAKSLFGKK